ncbi:hypothetical protein COT82_01995 [Candidatus Campbellbacteria bacterium CG10_big_fil_rev_8_21_14_0_10_35_52]|uniref:Uncharacterized protein n=1 Tax=Candidatus Campbellbacteria bacterium CG10_big_fil_rev_8_21_14_0_10_35_52 TaxID=1974527 RepID=A0A2M6WV16_9BACT|nr:MAG: hypothetical protein COT82_01995 [Candidatus Campbellbacteria bacterium CG10_big_fil_rev_8_21_14_0_10_35_52]
MFQEVSERRILNYIVLHAIHKELLIAVLKDKETLERIVSFNQNFPVYKKAWDIVEDRGHKLIIDKFKSFYIK